MSGTRSARALPCCQPGPNMPLPIVHLPVVQNWDCHVCGTCCKEYLVTVTAEEKARIDAQSWDRDRDLGGHEPFRRSGPPWNRRYHLNHRPDGSCVFLSEQGRCRIHEKFGYQTKPLPCRLFPFVLIPQGDRWGIGVRFACPSAAANKGRPVTKHDAELREFAELLAEREGLELEADGKLNKPPPLQSGQRVDWPDLHRFVQVLVKLLRVPTDRIERRLRKCLALAILCRQASFEQVKGKQLDEFLQIVSATVDSDQPRDFRTIPAPTWIGRVLFRQAVAIYTRKDHGPNQGLAGRGRLALLRAALRFARGRGPVPRMHAWIPETTFEQIEQSSSRLTPAAEDILERYYVTKVASLQF